MGQMVTAGEFPSHHKAWLTHRPSHLTSCAALPCTRDRVIQEAWGQSVINVRCWRRDQGNWKELSDLHQRQGETLIRQSSTNFWSYDLWTWEREKLVSWCHEILHNKSVITSWAKEGYFRFVPLKWEWTQTKGFLLLKQAMGLYILPFLGHFGPLVHPTETLLLSQWIMASPISASRVLLYHWCDTSLPVRSNHWLLLPPAIANIQWVRKELRSTWPSSIGWCHILKERHNKGSLISLLSSVSRIVNHNKNICS